MTEPSFRDTQRTKLREVAEAVIASEGLTAAQARRIAAEAGCSVGTLYNIYGDIDQLILAANETTLHDLACAVQVDITAAKGAMLEVRLMALALGYLAFASAHTLRWRAVFEQRLADEYPVPASYLENRARLLAMIEGELTDAIGEAGARGEAARALFSSVHGIVLLALDRKLGAFDEAATARQIRFVISHVVAGLA